MGETRRGVAEGPTPSAVVREVGGLAWGEGEVDDAVVLVDDPPVGLAAVLQVSGLEAGGVAAGQVEVGLGGGVGEAVVAASAEAVLVRAELVGEDGLDL